MSFLSPLRYPGGKRQLANFIKLVLRQNRLQDGVYVEPFAGGASVALALLYEERVRRVHINDFDWAIYAFWHAVLHETEALCRLLDQVPVDLTTWRKQREVQAQKGSVGLLELGFSTLFLNRVNRSGIITGGVIGGLKQDGPWKLDARYNVETLKSRIRRVASYRQRITLSRVEAIDLVENEVGALPARTLLYLDPPYFVKGRSLLYANFYGPHDHARLAEALKESGRHWIVSYDDVPPVCRLYRGFQRLRYGINYSASDRGRGGEVMFASPSLTLPKVQSAIRIPDKAVREYVA